MDDKSSPIGHQSERRKEKRISESIELDIVVASGFIAGDLLAGEIVNLSNSGLGVVLSKDLGVGTQLNITIYFLEEQSFCTGIIKWQKKCEEKFIYGISVIRWGYLDPKLKDKITLLY